MKTFTEEQLNSLIDELQLELPALLKAEMSAESLRKDEFKKPGEEDESAAPEAAPDASASSEPAPDESASAAPEGQEAPPEGQEAPPEGPPGEDHPEAQEGQAEQTLEQAYGALPMEELQAHYEALKAVLMSHMGQQQAPGQEAPPAAPAAPEAPPAAPLAPSPSAPAMKSEADFGEELKKSEDKIVALEKQIESVTSILEGLISRPTSKAVTSMAQFVAKSELDKPSTPALSRAEAFEKIKRVAQRTDLSKSDRQLISKFTLDQSVSVKEIEYLLK